MTRASQASRRAVAAESGPDQSRVAPAVPSRRSNVSRAIVTVMVAAAPWLAGERSAPA